jgi:hypothetical protein
MIPPSTYNTSISLSDVCAWKYHTEILELQRDGREIEVMYVLGSIIISLPSLCNSNISV